MHVPLAQEFQDSGFYHVHPVNPVQKVFSKRPLRLIFCIPVSETPRCLKANDLLFLLGVEQFFDAVDGVHGFFRRELDALTNHDVCDILSTGRVARTFHIWLFSGRWPEKQATATALRGYIV